MVDDERVAGVIEGVGEDNSAAVGRLDWSAGGTSKVGATVRAPRFAVQDRARAERAVRGLRHGRYEGAVPQLRTG